MALGTSSEVTFKACAKSSEELRDTLSSIATPFPALQNSPLRSLQALQWNLFRILDLLKLASMRWNGAIRIYMRGFFAVRKPMRR